jgi:hypothetical protein
MKTLINWFVKPDHDTLWMVRNKEGNVDLHKITPAPENVNIAFSVQCAIRPMHFYGHSKTELVFCDFASAGNLWSESNLFRTWIPQGK